jgi:hypothetical protein
VQDKLKRKTIIGKNVTTRDLENNDPWNNFLYVVSLTLLICTSALCDCISNSDNVLSIVVVALCSYKHAVTPVLFSLNNFLFNRPPGPWKTAIAVPRRRQTSELQPPPRQRTVPKNEATSTDDTTHQTSSEIKEKYFIRIIKMAVFIFRKVSNRSGSHPCFDKVYSSVSVFFTSYQDQHSTFTVWSSNIIPDKLKGRG